MKAAPRQDPNVSSLADTVAAASDVPVLLSTTPADGSSFSHADEVSDRDARHLAEWLVARRFNPSPTCVTWLNHYSAQVVMDTCPELLGEFDIVGTDGILLRNLIGGSTRTSADLVLPHLLPAMVNARVMIIGGCADVVGENARCVLNSLGEGSVIVASIDGYNGLPTGEALADLVRRLNPDLVLVGLGAGRQEQVSLEVAAAMHHGLVLTCGGCLDQMRHGTYYPDWAYPLKLNWLVRLAREPRRLWRRYTVDAIRAYRRRSELQQGIWALNGYRTQDCLPQVGVLPMIDLRDPEAAPGAIETTDVVIDLRDSVAAPRVETTQPMVIDLRDEVRDQREPVDASSISAADAPSIVL